MDIRAVLVGLGRLVGFMLGGFWLFCLYAFTAWIVVGLFGLDPVA
jgi:hypothetical protein